MFYLPQQQPQKQKQQMSNNEFFLLQIGKEFSHVLFFCTLKMKNIYNRHVYY